VSSRGGDEPRGDGREGASGDAVPDRVERGRGPRASWPLLLLAVLLLAVLLVALLFLWRSLGDSLSGSSVAKDSVDSGPTPRVRLANGPGQVRVEGVKGLDSVEYEVTKHAVAGDPAAAKEKAAGVPIDFSREDSAIVLETDGGRNTGADYALSVPSGGSVEIESQAGDVEISGLSGDVTVLAEAGDVTVRDVGGAVTVEAPQGDVTLANASTDTGQAEIEVGSGDVTLEDVVVGTLEARVEAGDVTLSGRFSGGGRVFVETGDITANLPPEDTRDLTLEASIGEVVRQAPSEEPAGNEEGAAREGG
jgi:phage baseplate assembly protein gpV